MNPALQELYKQTLLKHSKDMTHRRELPSATHASTLRNRLCGDEISVSLKIEDDRVEELAYRSQCCSICAASASMLAQAGAKRPVAELSGTARSLIDALNGDEPRAGGFEGDLDALNGVRAFPSRVRCATLPWEAYLEAVAAES